MTKNDIEKDTAKVKATMEKNDVFFVDDTVKTSDIVKADKKGQKIVFDIVNFPELSDEVYSQLSREAKAAYTMDARYAKKAQERMDNGSSPYSDIRDRLIAEDPLHVENALGNTGRVLGKAEENMHYIAAEPRHIDRMQRAGYKFVKPGEEEISGGVDKAGKVVLMGDNGKIDNIMMKVDADAYKKHIEIQGQKSQARLGDNLETTKEKMSKYSSKVTIYDDSKMDIIRPKKG